MNHFKIQLPFVVAFRRGPGGPPTEGGAGSGKLQA